MLPNTYECNIQNFIFRENIRDQINGVANSRTGKVIGPEIQDRSKGTDSSAFALCK